MTVHSAHSIIDAATRECTLDGYTSYPALCGELEKQIVLLCADLDALTGRTAIAGKGCKIVTRIMGDAEVLVEYEYSAGRPGVHTLPGGDPGYPADPAACDVTSVMVNGRWCDPSDFLRDLLRERWEEEIAQSEADEFAAGCADEARQQRKDWAAEDAP